MEDPYDEYKKDPSKYKAQFKRRMSAIEDKVRRVRLKDRIRQIRRELRLR